MPAQTVSQAVAERESTPAKPTPREVLVDILDKNKGAVGASLPTGYSQDRFVRLLLTAANTNPDLFTCDPRSFLAAGVGAAQLGLEPNDARGLAYLIPFKVQGKKKVQLIIGYKGMLDLARRSGMVSSINAFAVFKQDRFEYQFGLDPSLIHIPGDHDEKPEDLTHVYAVAKVNGDPQFVVLTRRQIDKVKAGSQGAKSSYSPWNSGYYVEMALKGLALETSIPTPWGWTTMEYLSPGDRVFDQFGQQCRVTSVSEVKHLDCYRVTFGDGESIVCDAEHLWVAKIANQKMRPRCVTEMYDAKQSGAAVTVPTAGPLDIPDVSLPIDPWVLGYWLGNGGHDRASVTANGDDVGHVTAAIAASGLLVGAVRHDSRGNAVNVGILGLKKRLADVGVLGHKRIPAEYLRASATQRLALLRGLMDSDGTYSGRGRVTFTSTDAGLAAGAAELARSLGEIVHVAQVDRSGYGKVVTSHDVYWTPSSNPFALPRKADRVPERKLPPYRTVTAVEKVDSEPTRCIAVDSVTRTFLAGRIMVPTHNTALRRLCKWLPQTVEMAHALERDERELTISDLGTIGHGDIVDADVIDVDTETGEITEASGTLLPPDDAS